jgi:hypothetical protein
MYRIEAGHVSTDNCRVLAMAKAPRLGNLHRYFPKWWHKAEPQTVALENFQPRDDPSGDQQEESRFEQFAEIALHETPSRHKSAKKAA